MLSKSRLIQLFVMLSLLIGLFVWRTIDLSESNKQKTTENEGLVNLEGPVCDFSQACHYNSPLGDFSLSVEEGKIIPEQWFHLKLTSDLQDWKVKSAKIVGKTMFMGKIPIAFSTPQVIHTGFQSTAKTMIGVCTEDKMLWRLEIKVETNGKILVLNYDFLIIK